MQLKPGTADAQATDADLDCTYLWPSAHQEQVADWARGNTAKGGRQYKQYESNRSRPESFFTREEIVCSHCFVSLSAAVDSTNRGEIKPSKTREGIAEKGFSSPEEAKWKKSASTAPTSMIANRLGS